MATTEINTDLDIRDTETGETYYVVADKSRGGRCVMNGLFIAIWLDKADAKTFANTHADYTVVKQLRAAS